MRDPRFENLGIAAAIIAAASPSAGILLPFGVESPKLVPDVSIYGASISVAAALGIIGLLRLWDRNRNKCGLERFWGMQLERFSEEERDGGTLFRLGSMLANFQSVNGDVKSAYGVMFYTEYLEQIRYLRSSVENAMEPGGEADAGLLAAYVVTRLRELVGRV